MAFPRVRFTIRRVMVFVALAAVVSGLASRIQRVSEANVREACCNNLRNIALAVTVFSEAKGSYPAGTVANDRFPTERRLSWLVAIAAYLDQWRWLLDLDRPWDADENRVTRGQGTVGPPTAVGRLHIMTCPAASGGREEHMPGWTWYVGIAGLGPDAPELPVGHPRAGVFGYDRRTKPADITDGLATTLLIAETDVDNGPWTAGGPTTVRGLDPSRKPYIGPGRPFGGFHPGSVVVAFADGSVRPLRDTIDPKVFEALSTAAGGEALPAAWDR
ncbi:hypothetical protein OJF2_31630 [Aquisphaera giovannonii]|uniref:DUF1559 domain-containing protein n=1 Tax=Aquisphaera giovannonii TaxID=406548 RepID=A0A5B9W1T9_9BACT|nr:DUF1559 domain-containing protein [Aquisphaera giovannonii]QEH34622.1 hypothetical protein OJF2_31630 [Aquisphaera giovannonii]